MEYKMGRYRVSLKTSEDKYYFLYLSTKQGQASYYFKGGTCPSLGNVLTCNNGTISGESDGYYVELDYDIESWFD
eukprot:gnl/Chilomastix_caulleri/5487.p1 GENE.gnl/Chilomastix_caulleri/5487~~gnl/Chilomastix_caulleri/5487.p1  ORF type:complete len:75 (-),score=7.21 gnl/Chilomastix_caulleri/5487:121-345(-)